MSPSEAASLIGSIAVLIGAVVAYRKFGPERNDITITSATKVNSMTLGFADAVNKDNEGLREDLEELKNEFHEYKRDVNKQLSEQAVELRAERAEKKKFKDENVLLRDRVQALEDEVRQLKRGNPHE